MVNLLDSQAGPTLSIAFLGVVLYHDGHAGGAFQVAVWELRCAGWPHFTDRFWEQVDCRQLSLPAGFKDAGPATSGSRNIPAGRGGEVQPP